MLLLQAKRELSAVVELCSLGRHAMRIDLAPSRIPELETVSDSYRRLVLDRAYRLVRKETWILTYMPTILCFLFGFGGWLGGAHLCVSLFTGDRMLSSLYG